ncbi:MAG: DUF952 domain-containing protein [Balneolaceae bacterium]
MKSELIFHLVTADKWKERLQNSWYTIGENDLPADESENIKIPCCKPDQVEKVANRKFLENESVLLLVIDPNRLEKPVRYQDNADEEFLWIEKGLNSSAILDKIELTLNDEGLYSVEITTRD